MRQRKAGSVVALAFCVLLFGGSCERSLGDAARAGDVGRVECLLAEGADPNEPDGEGWVPLQHAAKGRQERVASILLAHGAAASGGAVSALHLAAGHGSVGVAWLLLDGGADPNATHPAYGSPLNTVVALDESWSREVAVIVKALISCGAEPNAANSEGMTPLMVAALMGHSEVVGLLLSAGAQVDAKDGEGRSCLHYAARGGSIPVVTDLLHHGADPSAVSNDGQTPAGAAMKAGHRRLADLLATDG